MRQIEMVNTGGERLLALVNDLLDLSKIEAGKTGLVISIFSLEDPVSATVEILRFAAEEKGLEVEIVIAKQGTTLRTDLRAVEQILINLATNAIKFTESGTIALIASVTEEGRAIFRVCDTGPGIREEDFESIFDPFRQADRPIVDQELKGTGLGLAISARLADRLNGSLTV